MLQERRADWQAVALSQRALSERVAAHVAVGAHAVAVAKKVLTLGRRARQSYVLPRAEAFARVWRGGQRLRVQQRTKCC